MRNCICLFFFIIKFQVFGQTGSENFLFDVNSKNGKIVLSIGKNITNHNGYYNQPSFHTKEPIIYFSSFNEDGRSDIKQYNF